MRVIVCVKQKVDGELNPFDACAYEAALRIDGAHVILLSMAPEKSRDMLAELMRLGAKEAYLLCDRAFAGSDTLATSYVLSEAIKRIGSDLVLCGRQTVDGDTGQVGPGTAEFLGFELISNALSLSVSGDEIACRTRTAESKKAKLPCLVTVERINDLRKPSIRSRRGEVTVLNASDLGVDVAHTGISGSPTQVVRSFENNADKRKCTYISARELSGIIQSSLAADKKTANEVSTGDKLDEIWIIGDKPMEFAKTVSDNVVVIDKLNAEAIAELIRDKKPKAVLWDSTPWSKEAAARVAVMLRTGLCADCTRLEAEGDILYMYRPAFSGNVIAKIRCRTLPQMATVRTGEEGANIMVAVGKGAKGYVNEIRAFAESIGAELVASRGAVDDDMMPYTAQIGLTGRCVSPDVYITFGISGAVHHIVGMKNSATVISVNCDKKADIFDYSDYGITADISEVLKEILL